MVIYYEVIGYGINSSLGNERLVFTMGSHFDIDKDEHGSHMVQQKAIRELKRLWGNFTVQLKSIIKEK